MARSRRRREVLSERRLAFRFPVNGPRRQAVLLCGNDEFDAEVLDESAGGFAVEVAQVLDCRSNDMLMLRVGEDWFKVRVVFIDLQDVGVERFEGCNLKSCTRLGLSRVADDQPWKLTKRNPEKSGSRFLQPFVQVRKQRLTLTAMGIIAGLGAIIIGLLHVFDRSRPLDPIDRGDREARVAKIHDPLVIAPKAALSLKRDLEKQARQIEDELSSSSSPNRSQTIAKQMLKTERRSAPRATQSTSTQKPMKPLIPKAADELIKKAHKTMTKVDVPKLPAVDLDPSVIRRAHPSFLMKPHIAERLQLTEAQMVRLRKIAGEQRTAARAISGALVEDPQLAIGRRSLSVLTNDQRRHLAALQQVLPDDTDSEGNGDSSGKK